MAKRTLENCTLIKRLSKEHGYPWEYNDGSCSGYEQDFETHEICDKCKLCTSYEEEIDNDTFNLLQGMNELRGDK